MDINHYLSPLLVPLKTETLAIAITLNLFDLLDTPKSAQKIAEQLETDRENTAYLVEGLRMLGLLQESDGHYSNTPLSKKYFVHDSEYYYGDSYIQSQKMLAAAAGEIQNLVKNGKPSPLADPGSIWKGASKTHFPQEQRSLLADSAADIVSSLNGFSDCKKMLDLGCSAGILGLEIAKRKADLELVLFDYAPVTEVVQENINRYGLQARASVLAGDMQHDSIGDGYDLIWSRNIFYFYADRSALLQKLLDALNPGGILVSVHAELGRDSARYENAFFHFLSPLMMGNEAFVPHELDHALADAGFELEQRFDDPQLVLSPMIYHIARKPRV